MNTVFLALITGLTTGGLSCFAVQGGLLASVVTTQKEDRKKLIITFLLSKLIVYILLGALLGYVGTNIALTPKTQGIMQIAAGIFMLLTAAKIAELHPFFRNFTLTPPKALFRIARGASKKDGLAGSLLLGAATVLIPCGTTQAMMLLSVSSGSLFYGALILGAFVLGTSPLFFTLGIASHFLVSKKGLSYIAAFVIFYLGVLSINTGQILRGSVHTLQNYYKAATGSIETNSPQILAEVDTSGKQEVTIDVTTGGYSSDITTLKAGIPVSLKLISSDALGCSRTFTIPEYNISEILPETGEKIVEFTPTKTGRLTYTCAMGMYTGEFTVVN